MVWFVIVSSRHSVAASAGVGVVSASSGASSPLGERSAARIEQVAVSWSLPFRVASG